MKMKKISIIGVLLFTLLSVSCSKDVKNNLEQESSYDIENLFRVSQNLATYHSLGLESVYLRLKGKNLTGRSFVEVLQKKDVKYALNRFFEEELKKEAFIDAIKHFSSIQKNAQLRTSDDIVDNKKINEYFENFCTSLEEKGANFDLDVEIKETLKDPKLLNMTPTEQRVILMRLAIYEDSFRYWNKNYEKWIISEEALRSTKFRDGWLSNFWEETKRIAKEDAKGPKNSEIAAGAASGGAGGAIAGSVAGGVGAAPGAAIGAISGAVTTIIKSAVEASIVAASSDRNKENEGNNNGNQPEANGN